MAWQLVMLHKNVPRSEVYRFLNLEQNGESGFHNLSLGIGRDKVGSVQTSLAFNSAVATHHSHKSLTCVTLCVMLLQNHVLLTYDILNMEPIICYSSLNIQSAL